MRFYSQHGQDRYLFKNYFAGTRGRTFLDIGAHDGRAYSNTLFLEETLGWTGLCIEPSPVQFEKLRNVRRCACVQCAVSDYSGDGEFLEFSHLDMMGGLIHRYKERHIALANDCSIESRSIIVPVRRLDSILAETGISNIDYCSIDTEGAELSILQSYDPAKVFVDVFSIENVERDSNIRSLMSERGYHLEAVFYACDELYVRRDIARKTNESAFSTVSIAIPWRENLLRDGKLRARELVDTMESIKSQRFLTTTQVEVLLAVPDGVEMPPDFEICNVNIKLVNYSKTTRDFTTASLATCFDNARGAILAILDSRDSMHPDRLQIGLRSLESHDIVSTSGRFPLPDGTYAVTDETQFSGWMLHRHVWDRLRSDANRFDDSQSWIEQFRSMRFSCSHQVESGCPLTEQETKENRPNLLKQMLKFAPGSIVARHTLDRPLLERLTAI